WCAARLDEAVRRLSALPPSARTILINHWPLRRDLVDLPRNPRFAPWCGTRATEDWHRRFRAEAVISGHLHIRRTDHIDGTRFEEVSLGHPRQWHQALGVAAYLRQVLPAPTAVAAEVAVAAGD
ncbi:MAG: metallophosphoesterase, partial [Pseudomonadota bacterium]|nr:metallophosphoesterase [Pseudomonadota bacterium]